MYKKIISGLLLVVAVSTIVYILQDSNEEVTVTRVEYFNEKEGSVVRYRYNPKRIFGFGLTYISHAKETSQEILKAGPPIFIKEVDSLRVRPEFVAIPGQNQLLDMAEKTEPDLEKLIKKECSTINPLLDYEVELAFVLLEDVEWDKINKGISMPKIGFLLSIDYGSRYLQILGEGMKNRLDYWGASKSFPGFLPVNDKIWIPLVGTEDKVLKVDLKCLVNGEIRQHDTTANLIYSPGQMLQYIYSKYPDNLPEKGDVILTGTPDGIALQVSAWKAKLSSLLNFSRFTKVNLIVKSAGKDSRFLKSGDTVTVSGDILGSFTIVIK